MVKEDESLAVPVPTEQNSAPRQVNFPAITRDYRVVNRSGPLGFGLVANRNIKKGEKVFPNSYEFAFEDVQDGDVLRFDRYEEASRQSEKDIPPTYPITRHVLLCSHGIPFLVNSNKERNPSSNENDDDSRPTITWRLEMPGMLINHSCDPNLLDDSYDPARGEACAVRDIKEGEEMFCDYLFSDYDDFPYIEMCHCGAPVETCHCGAANCRGIMMGFKELSGDEKQRLLPYVSDAVRAMYEADFANGPAVTIKETCFSPRQRQVHPQVAANLENVKALPLVVPGPSCSIADILIQQNNNEKGDYGLYAARDFHEGETVYEFWVQHWPTTTTIEGDSKITPVDMIFSSPLLRGDPPEGTVVRVHALECAKRNRDGQLMFSGWDLFTAHSCEPNLVYHGNDEDDDWHGAYAAQFIGKGEQLSVDFNSIFWDRTTEGSLLGDDNNGSCSCGSTKCRGTVKGFRFLSPEYQEELKSLSWGRKPPPHDESKGRVIPGEALTPHVRVSWRQHSSSLAPCSLATSSSSSDESSSSEDEEE